MKSSRYFALFLLWISTIAVQGQGIAFYEGTWQEALDRAKKEDKIIFVDAYAKWCGPCKAMAKNTFTNEKVGEYFNQNFVNMKLDMEEGEGRRFEGTYPVSAYPTLFFIDGNGKIVKKVVGGQQVDGLLDIAKEALKSVDKSIPLSEEYNKGRRDVAFMTKYIKALNDAEKPSLKVVNEYLATNPKMTDEEKVAFYFEATSVSDSKVFETAIEMKDKMIKLVGQQKYDEKMTMVCDKTIDKAIEFEEEILLKEGIKHAVKALDKDKATAFEYSSKMKYFKAFGDKKNYLESAEMLAKKSASKNSEMLLSISQDMIKNYGDDPTILKKATSIAADGFKVEKTINSLNWYCNLLAKSNEIDKAIDIATKMLEEEKGKEGKNVPIIQGILNNLKARK